MIKSDFLSILKSLIQSNIPFSYPEDKKSSIPDFKKGPMKVETSTIKNILNYYKAKSLLQELDLRGLEWTYNELCDEYSREIMLKIVTFKLFENVKLRLPLYYDKTFNRLSMYEKQMLIDDEEINLWMDIIKLKKYDLRTIGYDIKMWLNFEAIFLDFMNEQYAYSDKIKVEKGDYVIDGGACYGDTALYFAAKSESKVFSFEFLGENIDIFNKNMDLNPKYKDNITLVKKPLSQKSGDKLFVVPNRPGTSVSEVKTDDSEEFETISIDDFVKQNNIEKIDFIKLDVECSEVSVLKGAVNTIRKFKPKLAICVYHKKDDLWTIPQLIKEILPEYNLHLDNHTIMSNETVMYAKI